VLTVVVDHVEETATKAHQIPSTLSDHHLAKACTQLQIEKK
jgi:hypothetical protein